MALSVTGTDRVMNSEKRQRDRRARHTVSLALISSEEKDRNFD